MENQPRKYRRYSKSEKIRILRECEENGVKVTLEKHGIYPATYYSWKKDTRIFQDNSISIDNLRAASKEITRLKTELQHYKNMLAEEQLKGRLKDEILKKKYPKKN